MLTANQEKFVQNIIEGMNQADAYRSAYPKQRMSDKSVWETASKLMKNPKVVSRLTEIRAEMMKPSIMTAQQRLEWLTELVNDTITPTDSKLRALDIMNKMTGEYTQKIEANVTNEVNINVELVDD